jgi:hypothetical protein
MTLAAGWFALHFTSRYLVWDEWDLVDGLASQRPLLDWLWSWHVDHRIPLPRLVFWAVSRVFGPDPRPWSAMTVSLLSGVALAMIRTARRIRGRADIADAVYPLLLLNWGHYADLLTGFQLSFSLTVAISFGWLVGCLRPDGRGRVIWTAMAALLLPLCGTQGIPFVAPIVAWLAWMAWRSDDRRRSAASGVVAMAAAIEIVLYFHGRPQGDPTFEKRSVGAAACTSLELLSQVWGRTGDAGWPATAVAAVGLVLATIAGLAVAWVRCPADRSRVGAVAAFLAGQLALVVAVGWGRCGAGPGAGFAARYTLLAAPLACVAGLASTAFGDRVGRAGPVVLFAAAAMMLVPNTSAGLTAGRMHAVHMWAFGADIRAGAAPEVIAARHAFVYRHAAAFATYLRRLRDAGCPRYATVREAAGCTVEAVVGGGPADQPVLGGVDDGLDYHLPGPRQVYGVRVRFRFLGRPPVPPTFARCRWGLGAADGGEQVDVSSKLVDGHTVEACFVVGTTIDRFRVTPDAGPWAVKVESVSVWAGRGPTAAAPAR